MLSVNFLDMDFAQSSCGSLMSSAWALGDKRYPDLRLPLSLDAGLSASYRPPPPLAPLPIPGQDRKQPRFLRSHVGLIVAESRRRRPLGHCKHMTR
ncbi:hypothetical protein GJAV_G00200620 [Gymnothorax javanicus]|nr:hypothetical protein GJAV_G00200620 [Gymnothorax javanicus]